MANKIPVSINIGIFLIYFHFFPSGFALEDPAVHAARIHRMIKLGLCIDDDDVDAVEDAAGNLFSDTDPF